MGFFFASHLGLNLFILAPDLLSSGTYSNTFLISPVAFPVAQHEANWVEWTGLTQEHRNSVTIYTWTLIPFIFRLNIQERYKLLIMAIWPASVIIMI